MASKKRQQRQLRRRRRMEQDPADATRISNNDEPRQVGAMHSEKGLDEREAESTKRREGKINGRSSINVVDSFPGSVSSWASTLTRKRASFSVTSTESSFPRIMPTATSAITTVLVFLLSLVIRNYDYLRQVIAINQAWTSVSALVYVALLPFLLWWMIYNAARIFDSPSRKYQMERTSSDEIATELETTDDEILTIRPLGLRRPSTTVIDDTNDETNNSENGKKERSPHPIPILATSEHVRTKFAEWLPFGLRYTSDLNLVFSTDVHGRSLQTLYHRLGATDSSHTILLLEAFLPTPTGRGPLSGSKSIVGMYASHRWHSSPKIYGDGRCFLFRFSLPDDQDDEKHNKSKASLSKCWNWTHSVLPPCHSTNKSNQYNNRHANDENAMSLLETFQRSNHDSMSLGIGATGIGAGLQLNHDMTIGESYRAVGFDNEPLVGGCGNGAETGGIFEVGLVEVYQLVREIDGLPIK